MKITAKQFAKSPLEAYRRADRGEEVIIEHARYPDIEFRLMTKPKNTGSLIMLYENTKENQERIRRGEQPTPIE